MFRTGRLIWKLFRRSAHIQKKRMAMTVAAIAWGTLSIVLLLSFGEGLKRELRHAAARVSARGSSWSGRTATGQGVRRLSRRGAASSSPRRTSSCCAPHIPEIASTSAEMRRWGNNVVLRTHAA